MTTEPITRTYYDKRATWTMMIGLTAIVLALVLSAVVVVASNRSTLDEIQGLQRQRQEENSCFAKRQAEYDVAVARAVLAPKEKQPEAIAELDKVLVKVKAMEDECYRR